MSKIIKKINKIIYKIFTKRWSILILKNENFDSINELIDLIKSINTAKLDKDITNPKIIKNAADPFLFKEDIYYEKLNWPYTKGYIESFNIRNTNKKNIYLKNFPHTSFPTVYSYNSELFLLTESQSWSYPFFYKITNHINNRNNENKKIIFESKSYKLIDPFILKKNNIYYLFGTNNKLKKLLLFHSKKLFGPYKKHKNALFKNHKESFRSGGKILNYKNEYYRISQKFNKSYGDGLEIYKIKSITTSCYREEFVDQFSFNSKNGPHTLSLNSRYIALDFFQFSIDPLAKFKRLIQLLYRFFKNVLFS